MQKMFDPQTNYQNTRSNIGYVPLRDASQQDYDRIGFMSGLEVHQQLLTSEKLFCRCPAGVFQSDNEYDAEVIRHMRPTLSELGEYDGTALMEFRTRKEIVYKLKNVTTCTYEVDDTPPFPINREALDIAIRISLLCKLNIVGEVHITRKQYLDGSIPTGFQRTAIIGVEGELPLRHKKIRLIQLSIEEDSCREISDIGHVRVYKTDRLGMPLIETVTYPECVNPAEVEETCNYIRFLNRSTGLVRTGMGASRQDVNVSCRGGSRVEIKGVAHARWIPRLTHNEAFRQWALLAIKNILLERYAASSWTVSHTVLDKKQVKVAHIAKKDKIKKRAVAINLPGFAGILSHFLQPGKTFADELANRLKVIACIEKPNMTHSEDFESVLTDEDWMKIRSLLGSNEQDAQVVIFGPEADIKTAIETIEERCRMAFEGVPKETRKALSDGTTIFERVLPGADRMYPDTDSAPIPLSNEYIEKLSTGLPAEIIDRYHQLQTWEAPVDTYTYILKKNLVPVIEKIINDLELSPKFVTAFFGHTLKFVEGHFNRSADFRYEQIYDIFKYLKSSKLGLELARKILPVMYEHPNMDFQSVLMSINYKHCTYAEIVSRIEFLKQRFLGINTSTDPEARANWIMGQIRKLAEGNIDLRELRKALNN
ncbi:MAG: Glu-tRNA(Gln) amidotransferase subunit GatE [Ignavibacteria bacterium]|nr:Glu-tRNA(Gln) amidotransferase subunit GatE [Ignavibacteria bacterium]